MHRPFDLPDPGLYQDDKQTAVMESQQSGYPLCSVSFRSLNRYTPHVTRQFLLSDSLGTMQWAQFITQPQPACKGSGGIIDE